MILKPLKKEELNSQVEQHKAKVAASWIGVGAVLALVGLIVLIRKRRKNQN